MRATRTLSMAGQVRLYMFGTKLDLGSNIKFMLVYISCSLSLSYCSVGSGLHVELKAEKKALLVGETLIVNCVANGSDLLDQQWKYPGKMVRVKYSTNFPTKFHL